MSPLYGLVLAGGRSQRMGQDKAALQVAGQSLLQRSYALIDAVCEQSFVSVRAADNTGLRAGYPQIADQFGGQGPADGIASAQRTHPAAAWLVVACDLPMLDATTLNELIRQRNINSDATAYRSSNDDLPEPLCAIYEPDSATRIVEFLQADIRCPRKMLINMNTTLLTQPNVGALDNANTPEQWAQSVETVG